MGYFKTEIIEGVGFIWFDQPGEKVNVLNQEVVETFPQYLDEMIGNPDCQAIVLMSRKEAGFIAGADIEMLKAIDKAEDAQKLSQDGQVLLDRVAHCTKPVIAAIHGSCLGGGLEVAMACHYRIAANHPKTVFALPEVKLGLLPGGGGTQRLRKLVGLQAALDASLAGKNLYARKAYKQGLVDMLVPLESLQHSAIQFAKDVVNKPFSRKIKRGLSTKLLEGNPLGRSLVFRLAKKSVLGKTKGNYPAPLEILESIKASYSGKTSGYRREAEGFGKLVVSPEAQSLMGLFFNMNASKKIPETMGARPVKRLGVVGAGLMGTGIAQVSASESLEVHLKDLKHESLAKSQKTIEKAERKLVKKRIKRSFAADRDQSYIHFTTEDESLAQVDIVIEAVFEDLNLKHRILADMERITKPDCIFASNTSAIPIGDIAAKAKRPEQVIGLHYFSPVPKMPLLELIVTPQTADWVIATGWQLGIRQGKTVIVVQDGPGFYTTRILAPMLNEALLLLDEGAEINQLDSAMRQFGFPVGPCALIDEVGIDVGAHVSETMSPMFAKRGGVTSEGFSKLIAAGYQGRKNGKGFYQYDGKKKRINAAAYEFFGGSTRKAFPTQEIQDRLALMMTIEAAHCLKEGIIASPRDGDLGAILGLGFPPFLGGPFHWIRTVGEGQMADKAKALAEKHGARFGEHLNFSFEH